MASIDSVPVDAQRVADMLKNMPLPKRRSQETPEKQDAISGLRKEPDAAQDAQELAKKLNTVLNTSDTSLRFSVHDETKTIVVKVVDDTTGEVIREIPQSKFLDMVAQLEELVGFMIDKKA